MSGRIAKDAPKPKASGPSFFITQSAGLRQDGMEWGGDEQEGAARGRFFPSSPLSGPFSSLLAPHQLVQAQSEVNKVGAAVTSTAVTALVRKLMASKMRSGGQDPSTKFEFSSEELARWITEAMSTLSSEARAAVMVLLDLSSRERQSSSQSLRALEEQVSRLGDHLEEHTRRQAIKVDTQTVDRAMSLLNDLQDAKRKMASYQDAAFRATEVAFIEAQKQWGQVLDDMNNKILIHQANYSALRSDMQRAALESLMEVRRDALDRAFAMGRVGKEGAGGLQQLLEIESELASSQAEVLEMQRSNVKTQTWFKMRSHAFQTVCMREVVAAREQVENLEVQMWVDREKKETLIGHLSSQLQATQHDLEASNAALARTDASLGQALASNKRLHQSQIQDQPKMEALRMEVESLKSGREGQQREREREKLRLSQSKMPALPFYNLTSSATHNGTKGDRGASSLASARDSPPVGRGGGRRAETDEVADLKAELESLRIELGEERRARESLVHRLGLGSNDPMLMGLKGVGVGRGGSAAVMEELRNERDALKQGLAAVKLASPDLFHALGLGTLHSYRE